MILRTHPASPGERTMAAALSSWERQLVLESLGRWLIRGGMSAFVLASAVLLVGWIIPQPESNLRPVAVELALAPLAAAALVAVWPRKHLRRAADLDERLGFGDRLATAWTFRSSEQAIVRLQRADAIERLRQRTAQTDLLWKPARVELVALGVTAALFLLLLVVPSPQQAVLDRQAAEQLAVVQAGAQLDTLRQDAQLTAGLSPEQTHQIDEILQQAQAELNRAHTQQEATAVLARAQDQLAQQVGDPNADLRDQALAAMSETLAAEPQTRALADALQREDAQATSDALKSIAAQADRLSDVERQALSRALQRAANVGRGEPRTSSALRDAAQAVSANSASSADAALSSADAAMQQAIQASQAQASLNATLQRLRDLQTQVASGSPAGPNAAQPSDARGAATATAPGMAIGTPVALNSGGEQRLEEPSTDQVRGAGVGTAAGGSTGSAGDAGAMAAENVFVPGREGNGPASQDLVDQPFTLRGAPRPYRDVLSQYAQSSRDYVDRPDVSPAVRDLVKQYFQSLEEGS
jgi:hypothetical protein